MDHPVIHWLMNDARKIPESPSFLEAFAGQLRQTGVDVARITTGVPILHPQIVSFSGLWRLGVGVSERLYQHDDNVRDALSASPILVAYSGGGPVRCRLTYPPVEGEYPILADLRREGLTDYFVIAVPFADGSHKALSFATARPSGFSDTDIALFEAAVPAIAFHLEVQALRRTASTLLDTYVGHLTGRRVLEGHIRRGMGETIRAVIWLCDLRGFTSMSEALPRDVLIEMLNAYFGPMGDAVTEHHGEILKFIGDAMLAIFPVDGDPAAACSNALAAARKAQQALVQENAQRAARGAQRIDYGIALHIGDVIYGNIGSDTRLDFTVIGPAVNLTARLEGLCRDLDRKLVLSSDFVAAGGIAAQSLGAFALKGVAAKQEVFGIA